jgi:signal transduction histidine kinase
VSTREASLWLARNVQRLDPLQKSLPSLHEFLFANRDGIIARARAKVATRPVPPATEEELASGIPLFFDQLIAILRFPSTSSEAIVESATRHGRVLLKRGFTVAQVVHDYGSVCQAVTELADETDASITPAEFNTFNRCLDEAIAQAVTEYGHQRERSLTDDESERLGIFAHELRGSLGVAMLSFQTIKSGSVGPSGSTAAVLERSLRRIAELIESSIAQTRLDAGALAAEHVPVRELIEEIEASATMNAQALGLTLTVAPVESDIEVKVDRQLLAAAIANLLQNAFKFTRPLGHVSLNTSASPDRVAIEVVDECGGLPPGNPEELFGRFQQRGRNRTGLGLGLWISRRSVEANGGEIHVRDKPGVGCVFTIDLPRVLMSPSFRRPRASFETGA